MENVDKVEPDLIISRSSYIEIAVTSYNISISNYNEYVRKDDSELLRWATIPLYQCIMQYLLHLLKKNGLSRSHEPNLAHMINILDKKQINIELLESLEDTDKYSKFIERIEHEWYIDANHNCRFRFDFNYFNKVAKAIRPILEKEYSIENGTKPTLKELIENRR